MQNGLSVKRLSVFLCVFALCFSLSFPVRAVSLSEVSLEEWPVYENREVTADAFIVMEASTGRVLMGKNIHEHLTEMVEETKDSPDPLVLTRPDVKRLFELSGVPEEKMETFDRAYDAAAGEDTALLASNIASGRSFSIETPDVVIKVNPERTDLIETRIIDGKECLVITVNDRIEVNGVNVRTMALPRNGEEEDLME